MKTNSTADLEHGSEIDLWLGAPVDDATLSPVDRKLYPREARQPDAWRFLDAPGRATVCTCAMDEMRENPDVTDWSLAGRIFERLDRRMVDAKPAEAARLLEIRTILSGLGGSWAPDLHWRLARRGPLLKVLLEECAWRFRLIRQLEGAGLGALMLLRKNLDAEIVLAEGQP